VQAVAAESLDFESGLLSNQQTRWGWTVHPTVLVLPTVKVAVSPTGHNNTKTNGNDALALSLTQELIVDQVVYQTTHFSECCVGIITDTNLNN